MPYGSDPFLAIVLDLPEALYLRALEFLGFLCSIIGSLAVGVSSMFNLPLIVSGISAALCSTFVIIKTIVFDSRGSS